MGSGGSKQTEIKKIHKSNKKKKKPKPKPQPKPQPQLPQRKERHNELQDPHSQRPVELSWLQQNNKNDNYNRIDRHHHHHVHYDEHLRRTPIAINRWPKDNEQIKEQKPKSFVEEYVRQ